MIWPDPTNGFSPYRDYEPVTEFFEEDPRRGLTALFATLFIHLILYLLIEPILVIPTFEDIEEKEPEPVYVELVTPEQLNPEPEPVLEEPEPEPVPLELPVPEPEPEPEPEPIVPEPVIPEPIIEPEPVIQPEPEIIPEPVIEPEPVFEPPPPEPEILPEPVFQPEPEPTPEEPVIVPPPPEIIANQEPALPEFETVAPERPGFEDLEAPQIDTVTPTPEFEAPPRPVFEGAERPDFEFTGPARPDFGPVEIDITDPNRPRPDFEAAPAPVFAPAERPNIGRVAGPGRPDLEITTDITLPQRPTVIFERPPAPQVSRDTPPVETIDGGPISTNQPSVLASDEQAQTAEELASAVPEEQVDTGLTNNLGNPPSGGAPIYSGGATPPGGGTPPGSRPGAAPGTDGWTYTGIGEEGEGWGEQIVLDMRCREAGRTHEDCPEYLRTWQGRGADGYEGFGAHSTVGVPSQNSGSSAGGGSNNSYAIGGGNDIFSGSGIGDNSINNGGPSTTIFDDTNVHSDFGRLPPEGSAPRVRDLITNQPPPDYDINDILINPPEDEEDDE